MKFRFTATAAMVFAITFVASAEAQSPTTSPHPREDAQLKAIYTAESAWRKAQPGGSDDENDETILPELPKVDEATQQSDLAHWIKVMSQLDALKVSALSPAENLNYRVFRAQIAVLINSEKFRDYEMPVNSDSAFWSGISDPPLNSFKKTDDYTNYLAQLNDTPRFFNEEVANMRAGLARHFTPPKVTLKGRDLSIAAIAEARHPEDTPFWKPFATMPASIPESTQSELRLKAHAVIEQKIIPAYAALLKFFREEYVPGAQESLAAESLPDGKAYYRSKILEYATVDLSPAQIHEIGLHEMAGIHAEMLTAIQQTGFKGDFPAFLQYLRTDPQFYAKTPEELLMRAAFIAKEFDDVAARYFGYLPRARFGIRPVPAEIAPFYTSGRGGPGVYFVNTYDLPTRGLYSLPALTLHESAPGHAFQIPIAMEHKELPKFRGAYISAYGEGWAVYCERLGTEMGIYHTPYETFGMLSYQAWRAARLVVDTGIHSQGWTREQAQQYLHDNTALSDHEIETEVDRYISWPGQALSYYLGELSILKERHKAEAALGTKFNIRAFHDAVLETGSVPLPVLEEHLDQWIARGGTGPYPEMER